MTNQMENYTRQCFNYVAVDEGKVDRLIKAGKDKDGAEGAAARVALREIYKLMQKGQATWKGVRCGIRKYMDDAFVQHLGSRSKVDDLFADQRSQGWKVAMDAYWKNLIEGLPKVIGIIATMDKSINEDEKDAFNPLTWCVAKMKVLRFLAMNEKAEKSSLLLVPFMSRSVYTHMVRKLELIDEALKEVSLYHHVVHCIRVKVETPWDIRTLYLNARYIDLSSLTYIIALRYSSLVGGSP